MVKPRRDRHDIVYAILREARAGRNKTKLMRNVRLSFTQAEQYLELLSKKGLLELTDSRDYKTTENGLRFLEQCRGCFLFEWNRQKE